ncbi:MAG: hypothetical protein IT176_10550 [Acidobacteria bacterium]|nr:hypothetical protein [Acidobacteriota bacterium]
MVTRGIRGFMERDWDAARASKDAYWRDRIVRLGAAEALRIAGELRRQMLMLRQDWPGAAQRRDDLLFHVHLAERLRRAGAARRG